MVFAVCRIGISMLCKFISPPLIAHVIKCTVSINLSPDGELTMSRKMTSYGDPDDTERLIAEHVAELVDELLENATELLNGADDTGPEDEDDGDGEPYIRFSRN